jgi:hypothetical protein
MSACGEAIALCQRFAGTGGCTQWRQQLCEALADWLLVVFAYELGQRAQVLGQPGQRRHDFVDRCDALRGKMGRLDPIDRDAEQPPLSEPDAEDASPLDLEAGRRPIIEELVGRNRQSYANDGHEVGSGRSTPSRTPVTE